MIPRRNHSQDRCASFRKNRMNKNYIILIIAFLSFSSYGQNLSINETISYINQSIRENRKIELNSDGYLTYSGLSKNNNKPFSYQIHISDIDKVKINSPSSNQFRIAGSENPWSVIISCEYRYEGQGIMAKKIGGDCITHKYEGFDSYGTNSGWKVKTTQEDKFELLTKDGAEYSTQKLYNAFSYLIEKAREKGYNKRVDDDPFAPQNFNQNSNKNTKQTKSQKTSKEQNENQNDVGFDPFLGQTTSSVNFRSGPSSSNSKIKTLSAGSTVYVYSNKSINNYYKAIDVMTSQIGWVHKNYVKYVQDVDVNEKGAFQSTGYTSSYNSEISIRNKSSYTIKLVVEEETFTLSPNSTKSVKVKPGRKYYIATAPGVIPASGYQSFQSNNGYEWEFWVETSRY